MSKRKYTKIQEIEPEIMSMRKAGQTLREIAEHFGLEKRQLENLVNRRNRRQKRIEAGIMPRPKGRPRKDAQGQREFAAWKTQQQAEPGKDNWAE